VATGASFRVMGGVGSRPAGRLPSASYFFRTVSSVRRFFTRHSVARSVNPNWKAKLFVRTTEKGIEETHVPPPCRLTAQRRNGGRSGFYRLTLRACTNTTSVLVTKISDLVVRIIHRIFLSQ
jgi:hypothetical protein